MLKAVAFATAMLAAPVVAQTLPPAVIVIVDMDQVFQTSTAGKQAAAELKTRADGIQARVQSLRTQYGTEEQNLQKSAPPQTATPAIIAAFQAKVKDYQTRRQRDEADLEKRNTDFQASRQAVLKQINDAAQPLITTVMRERGASIALAEGATLQHSNAIDVTTDIVSRLDKSLPRVSTATPAAAAPAK
ncbi:OmpH family outer membrane protein [Sphingosinicellaceae bacterium]|nr:OmpH family outer membrane protein [Sphingosinicellaceae bacterium]